MTTFAFDCFGTVFDMRGVPKSQVKAYVDHVRQPEWSPYQFPPSWYALVAHPDAAEGLRMLKDRGIFCWAFSNGNTELIEFNSKKNGIEWDRIIDLSIPQVYKPHPEAYQYLKQEAHSRQLIIITANPTFGDVEGAASIGVGSRVIRHGHPNTIIELAEMFPKRSSAAGWRSVE